MSEYRDMFGREIKKGDYIVYAALWDRSAQLRGGRVLELTRGKSEWSDAEKKKPKIRVCAAEWGWWRDKPKPVPQSKAVTLSYLERCIVVPDDFMSQEFKDAIAKVPEKGVVAQDRYGD